MKTIDLNQIPADIRQFISLPDLKQGVFRYTNNTIDLFDEDALHIMTTVRIAVDLDLDIAKNTVLAIWECGHNLANISQEQKTDEFIQILKSLYKLNRKSPHYNSLCRMVEYIIKRIIPEFQELAQFTHNNPYHYTDIFTHTMDMLFASRNKEEGEDIELLLTILFHDIGKIKARVFNDKRLTNHYYKHEIYSADMTKEILERMKFAPQTINRVVKLVKVHDFLLKPKPNTVKKLLNKLDLDLCSKLIIFQQYDKRAHRLNTEDYRRWLDDVAVFARLLNETIENNKSLKISDLEIDGFDIIKLGFKQGNAIGDMLNLCLDYVLENPEKNNKQDLINYVVEKI
jgi:tRNA nucleotidyltransferase (CCA-adding enzyme)